MIRTVIVVAVVAAAALTETTDTTRAAAARDRAPPSNAEQDPGRTIFMGKGNCFTCHGRDATGTPLAPDLTDGEWINFEGRPTAEQVRTLVKEGVSGPVSYPAPMPAMGGSSLSDGEVAAVAEYVLGLSPGS